MPEPAPLGRAPESDSPHPLLVAAVLSALLGAAVHTLPREASGTVVSALFLGVCWWRVWRFDDECVLRHGVAMGGLVLPKTPWRAFAQRALRAVAWGSGMMALVIVPYIVGFVLWHDLRAHAPHWPVPWWSPLRSFSLQFALIAFPEEAFYRGYLQTQLRRYERRTWRIFGAEIGVSVLYTSLIFALGHVLTVPTPARLLVFFPSLLFGWLRQRTGGIGAAMWFHALCNVLSETLVQSYSPRP